MQTADPHLLLREFTDQGSEDAFRELVRLHVNLVFSVALRRVGGDIQIAEDVTQTVFADLARQARQRRGPTGEGACPVAGWLHRHTCFVASTTLRSLRRRQAREQAAAEMNILHAPQEAQWETLAPELDEAVNRLPPEDRDAILLRFYEQRDLRSVGAALGVSDDAAQKRVARAVEKLRALLLQRGAAIPAASLTGILTTNAVQAAPAGLADRLGEAALAATAAGAAAWLAALLHSATSLKGALGLTAALAIVVVPAMLWREAATPANTRAPEAIQPSAASTNYSAAALSSASNADQSAAPLESAPAATNRLLLKVVAKEGGEPVPGVEIESRRWIDAKFASRDTLRANREGECAVELQAQITMLELITRSDGFADTRLEWRPDRGESIPDDYTIRLVRAVEIGGHVRDPGGHPIAGAKVGFNHEEAPMDASRPQSHRFGWIEVETDSEGRWRIRRIAEGMISRIYGSAKHDDYIQGSMLFVAREAQAEAELRAQRHVFTLKPALAAQGVVVDARNQPIAGAKITTGRAGSSGRKEAVTQADGSFLVRGCRPGPNVLTAEAEGYAPTSVEVEVNEGSAPVRIVLEAGSTLILRVVDVRGAPVADASVWHDTFASGRGASRTIQPQVQISLKTDGAGLAVWKQAPECELSIEAQKRGYMRVNDFKVRPDGREHSLVLPPALNISGTVRDSESGAPVPRFTIVCGWPSQIHAGNPPVLTNVPHWSTLDRHWLSFSGGEFRHTLEEAIVGGRDNPGYHFKFEARGYEPLITRLIAPDEGNVRLDVRMRPGESRTIAVSFPDGSPAPFIDVGFVNDTSRLDLMPNGFALRGQPSGTALTRTDEEGTFTLPLDRSFRKVVAAHSQGYGEAAIAELEAKPSLRLKPWGRIEGELWRFGRAATGQVVHLQAFPYTGTGLNFDNSSFKADVDDQGRFVFPHAPPGHHRLTRRQPVEGRSGWTYVPLGEVDVESGQTSQVHFGKDGGVLSARIDWPAKIEPRPNYRLQAIVATVMPEPPPDIAHDREAVARWAATPEIAAALKTYRTWPMEQQPDGSWMSDNLAPGDYVLGLMILDMESAPNTDPVRAHTQVPVTIAQNAKITHAGPISW